MARDHREIVEQGLQMKKAGNALMALVGGREVHPINVRVGGFYRAPTRAELRALVDPLERARETALATVRWTADARRSPTSSCDPELRRARATRIATRSTVGRIVSDRGLDIAPAEFDEHIVEEHVEHSNALHARLRERGTYLTGPLARYSLSSAVAAAAGPRGCARGRARARPAATRSRASSCAPSSSCRPCDEALAI